MAAGPAEGLAATWGSRQRGMWKFREVLPLHAGENPVSLGEGETPLVPLFETGSSCGIDLFVKDEGGNPTGSFKDRGLSAAVTRAVHDGAEAFVLPSAGNAGVALAAYAARAGRPATIVIPADTPPAVADRCRVYGAELVTIDGVISDCGAEASRLAASTGAFDLATLREPYRIEGKKTMGLEILAQLGWTTPAAIVYPTGGGTGLIGTWKAIREARALGLINGGATRMYVVQAAGCAPVVKAWKMAHETAEPWQNPRTSAWGLRVPSARGDRLMLQVLRESGGDAVAVDDADMVAAARRTARRDGFAPGIEGGATLAAVEHLAKRGAFAPGETVVAFNTGNLANYGW